MYACSSHSRQPSRHPHMHCVVVICGWWRLQHRRRSRWQLASSVVTVIRVWCPSRRCACRTCVVSKSVHFLRKHTNYEWYNVHPPISFTGDIGSRQVLQLQCHRCPRLWWWQLHLQPLTVVVVPVIVRTDSSCSWCCHSVVVGGGYELPRWWWSDVMCDVTGTHTHTHINPYPWARVRVSCGCGCGWG